MLDRHHVQQSLPPVLAGRRVGAFVWVAPYVFGVDTQLPTVLDEREAVEAVWVSRRELLDPTRHALSNVPGHPGQRRFPAVDLHGFPLWGFTYRVITEWLGISPEPKAREKAGFEAAKLVMQSLLSHGLKLERDWASDPTAQPAVPDQRVAKVATVTGPIPADLVLEQLAGHGSQVASVSYVDVRPEFIRITGLNFEEYQIFARPE